MRHVANASGVPIEETTLWRAILRRCVRDWEWLDHAPTIRLFEGADAAYPIPEQGSGAHAPAGAATASARYGGLRVDDRFNQRPVDALQLAISQKAMKPTQYPLVVPERSLVSLLSEP
jgi:hypothetical protein